MEFIYNYIWEKNSRIKNEDALSLLHVTKEKSEYLLAVVCDGIGGLSEGENASGFVADSLGKELLRLLETNKGIGKVKWRNVFLREISRCHHMLELYGKEKGIRLGTTMSMVFLCGNSGWIFHVGDSAVFFGRRKLKRRTGIDRTKQGALKSAIGPGQIPKIECKRIRVKRGSVILLSSDGFYQRVEKELVKECLESLRKKACNETDIRIWLRNKHREGVQRGEKDNTSAICMVCR